ncbi:MAG: endonuclease/exonuclease/phosphatase family protein [Fimbriiglobus sp.]
MELRVLFWNCYSKPLTTHLARLVETTRANVVAVAEWGGTDMELEACVSTVRPFRFIGGMSGSVRMVVHPDELEIDGQVDHPRYSILSSAYPARPKLILAVVHLRSKLRSTPADQTLAATHVMEVLRRVETASEHSRTIVFGDFNMNPFEDGMMVANGFNSSSTLWTTRNESRVADHVEYPQFYNPMWSHFGDRTPGPPGTYYFNDGAICYYWNMLDQVLLRPSVAEALTELRILDSDGKEPLVTKNGLPSERISDHLPLFFVIDWDKIKESL